MDSFIKNSALLIAALTLVVTPVRADVMTNSDDMTLSPWTVGVGAGGMFFEGDEEFKSTFLTDIKVGYDVTDEVTLETAVGWMPFLVSKDWTDSDPDTWHLNTSDAFRGSLDALYHLGRRGDVRPFVAATGGATYFANSLADNGHWVPFVGGGGGVSVPLQRQLAARADYRLLITTDEGEINHLGLLSLIYRFGTTSAVSGEQVGTYHETSVAEPMEQEELKTVYFNYDKSLLTADAQAKLRNNARYLQENPDVRIVIEGHCDERGTNEYNLALGDRRARAAYDYLRSLGISSDRMSTVSYGEERPAVEGHNEAAWAKNRRAVCVPQ